MTVRRGFCALALSSITVIGVAAPASAVTSTSPVTRTSTTLDCVGSHPVHATALLTARQVTVLQAVVMFINTHSVLFGTTCTVT